MNADVGISHERENQKENVGVRISVRMYAVPGIISFCSSTRRRCEL